MVRRSIGIVLLGAALAAFLVALLGGASTAAFEPFSHAPYYAFALPAAGFESGSASGLFVWVIPTLAGIGISGIVAVALLRSTAWRLSSSALRTNVPATSSAPLSSRSLNTSPSP